jgi:hypothetical protein
MSTVQNSVFQKGLQSLENPVLRGSFHLVCTPKQMDFYDRIAKEAFLEIIQYERKQATLTSCDLYTQHLSTDKGKVQNNRPGVYVLLNINNGKYIIGQTVNLKKRFNQYTSRGKGISEQIQINKNFFLSVQKELKKGFHYSQFIKRFVVYTWVDENKKPLDVRNSIVLQNEMNYLEHRLILAFFECGLAYNIADVSPKLAEFPDTDIGLEKESNISTQLISVQKNSFSRTTGPKSAKPFQVNGLCFLTTIDYVKYRNSLETERKKEFLSMPRLRKFLRANQENFFSNTRYLTDQEIQETHENNLFIRPE